MNSYKIIIITLGSTISLPLLAQVAPPATPIDGGISILLAALGVYGLKKLKDNRK